jgi:calcineurin-like phosphoesterase family protein
MNMEIIRRWNERVKPEDTVFHLGDLCFKETKDITSKYWTDQLNGDIILIRGNHDNRNSAKSVIDSLQITLGGKLWNLEHVPNFESTFKYNLSAHVHTAWKIKEIGDKIFYNVGVDVNEFFPITIEEIMRNISKMKKGIVV